MTTPDSIDQIQKLANFIMAEVPGEPSQSEGAVDCAIRWMRSALAASPQPANPAQVTDAMVDAARKALPPFKAPNDDTLRAAIAAAIGAGGQAVALSLAEKALAILTRWTGEAYLFSAHEISKAVGAPKKSTNKALSDLIAIGRVERVQCTNGTFYKLAALSQPHPADERVVEALVREPAPAVKGQGVGEAIVQELHAGGYLSPDGTMCHAPTSKILSAVNYTLPAIDTALVASPPPSGEVEALRKALKAALATHPGEQAPWKDLAVDALSVAPAAADGWRMVPVEPTLGQQNAGWREVGKQGFATEDTEVAPIYRAMAAAAPTATGGR